MRIAKVFVGMPREVESDGKKVLTGIFKSHVAGPIRVGRLNLEGDGQGDLKVHGGEFKAVYAYAEGHYSWWRSQSGTEEVETGVFGENLTISDFDESDACIGDVYEAGTALLQAVQPRLPCFKLAIKMGDPGIVKKFMDSERWGVYFRVEREGVLKEGDEFRRVSASADRIPVAELMSMIQDPDHDSERIRRAHAIPCLPPGWRDKLAKRLA